MSSDMVIDVDTFALSCYGFVVQQRIVLRNALISGSSMGISMV